MELALEIIRWVGLAVALLLTLVILKEAALVLRTLGHIRSLSADIRDAARGIAANLEPAGALPTLAEPIARLGEAGAGARAAANAVAERLTAATGE